MYEKILMIAKIRKSVNLQFNTSIIHNGNWNIILHAMLPLYL